MMLTLYLEVVKINANLQPKKKKKIQNWPNNEYNWGHYKN